MTNQLNSEATVKGFAFDTPNNTLRILIYKNQLDPNLAQTFDDICVWGGRDVMNEDSVGWEFYTGDLPMLSRVLSKYGMRCEKNGNIC